MAVTTQEPAPTATATRAVVSTRELVKTHG